MKDKKNEIVAAPSQIPKEKRNVASELDDRLEKLRESLPLSESRGVVSSPNGFQTEVLQKLLDSSLYDIRTAIHNDVQNLHVEMIRLFQSQQRDFIQTLNDFSDKMSSLVAENEELRRENNNLRRLY